MTGSESRRRGEVATDNPVPVDATIGFIGRLETPWTCRAACPRQGDHLDGPLCRIHIDHPWRPALEGIEACRELQVLYWMHQAERDLVRLAPRRLDGSAGLFRGPFALRAPTRPNPIASAVVTLVTVADGVLDVKGLDCVNGTPLLDLKPWRGINR